MLKSGRWARRWDKCRECGLDTRPHYAKGYCARCYMRLYKRQQRRSYRGAVMRPDTSSAATSAPAT